MKCNHLGTCRTIDGYVNQKLNTLRSRPVSFASLFELMFSEEDAVLYERSVGFKLVKTTYREAREVARKKACALRAALPDAPQDAVIGIHMENGVEWIEAFWATLAAGFCPLLLNLRLDLATLEDALADAHAVAVLSEAARFSLPTLAFSALDGTHKTTENAFGSRVTVMSTGTSGRVKLCSYTAKELFALIGDSAHIVRVSKQIKRHYKGELKLLAFLPFYHVFGLVAMYIWFAFFSRTFVHLADLEPATVLGTIRRHEVTHIFAVPLFWERIYDEAMRTIRKKGDKTFAAFGKGLAIAEALSFCPPLERAFRKKAFAPVRRELFGESVQFMITGGSPIRPEALAFFNNIGYHLTGGFGMSEIGITSVELSPSAHKRNSGSVGKPLPSVEYRIGASGELEVRGASLASTVSVGSEVQVRDSWFRTGDLAEEKKGSYYILGRADDLILLPGGEMLNPNLIEPAFIGLCDCVKEACLINAGKGGTVDPVLLLSIERSTARTTEQTLLHEARRLLDASGNNALIRKIVPVRGTLLGATDFKLNRRTVAERYLAGALSIAPKADARSDASDTENALARQVAAVFAAVLGMDAARVRPDADFFSDLEGSSLDYFALLAALKETFSLPFTETEALQFHTVRAVCRYIEEADRHAS